MAKSEGTTMMEIMSHIQKQKWNFITYSNIKVEQNQASTRATQHDVEHIYHFEWHISISRPQICSCYYLVARLGKRTNLLWRGDVIVIVNVIINVIVFVIVFKPRWGRELICCGMGMLLAPQSGALRISAYRDFHPIPNPIPTTYSFRAFKPFYGDQKQCK